MQPLPSCCSQTGWKTAPTLFTKPAGCMHYTWKYPKTKMRYVPLLYQLSKTPPLPEATWGMHIVVFCLKTAREQLITKNPSWKTKQEVSPEAIWNLRNAGTIPFLKPPTERIPPRMAKTCRLPKDSRNTASNANIGDTTDTHSQVFFHHI
jgi:hypothetical protein